MEALTDIFQLILQLIEAFFIGIFYYLFAFFFGAQPAATIVLKLFLLTQIVFLIHTAFRPAKWKWISLFIAEALLIIAGLVVFCVGGDEDNLGIFFYGIASAGWGFIMLVATLVCNSCAPFTRKKKAKGCAPVSTEETLEHC